MKEKREKEMSLRKQARILGISHTYLSMLVNGKRKWPEELKARYEELVTTSVTTSDRRTAIEDERNESSVPEKKAGGAEGIRTPDFLLAKEALSRTELQPHGFGFQDTTISQ